MIIPSTLLNVARRGGREKYYKVISLTCNIGFMEKAMVHSSSLDLGGDGEHIPLFITITVRGQEQNLSVAHRPSDLSRLLAVCCPKKVTHKSKNIFSRFCSSLCYGSEEENDTPSEPLPAIFC